MEIVGGRNVQDRWLESDNAIQYVCKKQKRNDV